MQKQHLEFPWALSSLHSPLTPLTPTRSTLSKSTHCQQSNSVAPPQLESISFQRHFFFFLPVSIYFSYLWNCILCIDLSNMVTSQGCRIVPPTWRSCFALSVTRSLAIALPTRPSVLHPWYYVVLRLLFFTLYNSLELFPSCVCQSFISLIPGNILWCGCTADYPFIHRKTFRLIEIWSCYG